MKRDWELLTATSYADSVAELREAVEEQDWDEVKQGLDLLFEAMSQESRRALKSQLVRLMAHILKWKLQPERRSRSWVLSILDACDKIEDIREDKPSLTRQFIEKELWETCFQRAVREAEVETGLKVRVDHLTWEEVFETEYRLPLRDS
jgi:hypothetical protein